jgi:tRNA(adenine34) deaminase
MIDREKLMEGALQEARRSGALGEVPVGALVLHDGSVIARGGNVRESKNDPTGHAEVVVLREAASKLHSWSLQDCLLVVTLEPCLMCAGAILNSRVARVMFGAYDLQAGAAGSRYNVLDDPRLNHRVDVVGGVLEHECASLLTEFFQERR